MIIKPELAPGPHRDEDVTFSMYLGHARKALAGGRRKPGFRAHDLSSPEG
jgi:hypothetical protein